MDQSQVTYSPDTQDQVTDPTQDPNAQVPILTVSPQVAQGMQQAGNFLPVDNTNPLISSVSPNTAIYIIIGLVIVIVFIVWQVNSRVSPFKLMLRPFIKSLN